MPLDPLARRSGPMPLDEAPPPLPVDEALERFRAARQRGPEPGWRGWWARWQQPLVGAGLLALFASVWFMDPPAPSVTVRPLGLPQERVSEEPAEAPTAASDVSPATERPASGPAAAPSR
jgi:hypothetical protein